MNAEIGVGGAVAANLERAIGRATDALLARQHDDGHWAFELEADATIPAEYVLLKHYLADDATQIDTDVERKIVRYLKSIQGAHGGWPLFHGGDFNISASVKAYYCLKICGEDIGQ
ncbi:MAG TPA: prenyltransferase/squalene oxidase repeat-containing protein, partial [Candidatus Binatia bacterium]|nr:prenyltransferase/squalene oxidase repeat-containing protein [Candidatus Binatia bacterium]